MKNTITISLPIHVRFDQLWQALGMLMDVPWVRQADNPDVDTTQPSTPDNPWRIVFFPSVPANFRMGPDNFNSERRIYFPDPVGRTHVWNAAHDQTGPLFPAVVIEEDHEAFVAAVGRCLVEVFGGRVDHCEYSFLAVAVHDARWAGPLQGETDDEQAHRFHTVLADISRMSARVMVDSIITTGILPNSDETHIVHALRTMERQDLEAAVAPGVAAARPKMM